MSTCVLISHSLLCIKQISSHGPIVNVLDIPGSRETVSGGRDTREVRILVFSRGWAAANAECLLRTESEVRV